MAGRLSRWYMAAAVAGGLYFLGWLFAAGYFGAVIQVDFQWAPALEGAILHHVSEAGTLQEPYGNHEAQSG